MASKNKDKVLVLRHNEQFRDAIEDWCAEQRPVPSRSEAIRTLTMRAIAAEKYLATILENILEPMAKAELFSEGADDSIYLRLQDFVLENVKFAAHLDSEDQAERLKSLIEFLQEQATTQETSDSGTAVS